MYKDAAVQMDTVFGDGSHAGQSGGGLMGNNPAHRFAFIQENAARLDEEVIDA